MAYHFVIGNKSESQDGQIHVGRRWKTQAIADLPSSEKGADQFGVIEVALVGDFESRGPTPSQLEALDELLDYLRMKTGVLRVDVHGGVESPAGHTGSCLGPGFPARQLIEELAVGRGG